ncbi:MAG: sulfurtransferase [Oscillatoriales cyanobacterium C42_A2020_001]|nr:sulfurtransferase [Leptolyngbyaceae cyanobacterium C42_A2020_001]
MMAPLVSVSWLFDHLDDPQVAIADCRFSLAQPALGRQQYEESHIPGAYYLDLNQDLSSPVTKHGGRHPLPNPDALAQKLNQMGVYSASANRSTLVVAYDDSRFAFASRLWWLLRYLGHNNVAVLDGGWTAWNAAGYPTTPAIPATKMGHFIPNPHPEKVVDIAQVKAQKELPGVILVDSREGDRFRGEREPIDPIAGHIPGAMNYPWQDVTNEQGLARSPEDQRQRWQAISDFNEVIVYCGSGVTACVNLLSLELAGISNAKLYAGSWSDWCSYEGLSVEC